jgi:hypothetical protein
MINRERSDSSSDELMRAVTVPRYGGPEVLSVRRIPRPTPAPGEILVRVAWGAVNERVDSADLATVAGYAATGMVSPPIGVRFPIEAADVAMRTAEMHGVSGRGLLQMA